MASFRHCVEPPSWELYSRASQSTDSPSRRSWCIWEWAGWSFLRCALCYTRSHGTAYSGLRWVDCSIPRASPSTLSSPVVLPCVLASICAGRKHLSLLCRAVLCCPASHLTTKGRCRCSQSRVRWMKSSACNRVPTRARRILTFSTSHGEWHWCLRHADSRASWHLPLGG